MPVELTGDFEGLLETIEQRMAEKLKEVADFTSERAREMCPYDSSKQPTPENPNAVHLRDTIKASEEVEADVLAVEVTAGDEEEGVTYGAYVELGTYKMAAQPFFGPAYEEGRAELEGGLGEIIPS